MEKDPKHPDRWRKVILCRTDDRGEAKKTFKEVILNICTQRSNVWGKQVKFRVHGALSDVHAADGRYHEDCKNSFMIPSAVQRAGNVNKSLNIADSEFDLLVQNMNLDETQI